MFTLAYFTLNQLQKLFHYVFRKLEKAKKTLSYFFLFTDAVFLLMNLLEIFLIVYITNLISFKNLRQLIFEFVNFNFSTNSNLRDLESFKIFYCNKNTNLYRDYNIGNNNKINQNLENSKYNINESTNINDLKSYICYMSNFLDGIYFEYCLLFLIVPRMIYKNIKSYYNKNYQGFGSIYKLYFFLLAFLQLIYFFYIYIGIAIIKKDSLEKMQSKTKEILDYENYQINVISNYRGNSYFDNGFSNSGNIVYDKSEIFQDVPDAYYQKSSLWKFLGQVLQFLMEILDT